VGPEITLEGQRVLNFASNNYLGLATDPRVQAAAIAAIQTYGAGATGSRLLSGHLAIHRDLELALAQWKGCEDGLVFSSGFAANLGAMVALVGPRDGIFGDAYNHASLKSGAALSQATLLEYRHGDMEHLADLLREHRGRFRRILIATDSVFSMDGDIAPLGAICDLADQWEAMVLVDEAHGTGVLGATGAGAVEALGLTRRALVQVGTLSKALGALGGYVVGPALVVDYLRHRARTWVYSTGLSPADTAAALASVVIIQQEPQVREQLWARVAQLQAGFRALGLPLFPTDSAILCWDTGSIPATLVMAEQLRRGGIFAPAIRPPTVPTSRIRFSVMATHQAWMVERVLDNIKQQNR